MTSPDPVELLLRTKLRNTVYDEDLQLIATFGAVHSRLRRPGRFGVHFTMRRTVTPSDTISPQCKADAVLNPAELFGPAEQQQTG